jgi:hypothetical protein
MGFVRIRNHRTFHARLNECGPGLGKKIRDVTRHGGSTQSESTCTRLELCLTKRALSEKHLTFGADRHGVTELESLDNFLHGGLCERFSNSFEMLFVLAACDFSKMTSLSLSDAHFRNIAVICTHLCNIT